MRPGVQQESIGIRPPGALGVALFYHTTRRLTQLAGAHFLVRPRSASARALESAGGIWIEFNGHTHRLSREQVCLPDLPVCWKEGVLPELLLACPNPDQLLGVLDETVNLIELAHASRRLGDADLPVPIVVLCSNGIFFQRLRQLYIERLEESTLLGRLPDLWPELMPKLVGRVLRGVTIQTGIREEMEGRTVYRPGPPGITHLAGGDAATRMRVAAILQGRGAWFEIAAHTSPTRLEFDKAMVNLTSNLLGQLIAIADDGRFRPMTVQDVHNKADPEKIRELVTHILAVGKSVRAYDNSESVDPHLQRVETIARQHADHVPSSLQWLELRLRQRNQRAELTPTEAWLLDPLIRYARASGLDDSAHYFEQLRESVLSRLAVAHRHKPAPHG